VLPDGPAKANVAAGGFRSGTGTKLYARHGIGYDYTNEFALVSLEIFGVQ
jgi:hypothetical protein